MNDSLMSTEEAVAALGGAGLTPSVIREPTHQERFRDQSTVIIMPTKGMIDYQVVYGLLNLCRPMNQKRDGPIFDIDHNGKTPEECVAVDGPMIASGYKVAEAYNALVQGILETPGLKDHKYLMTIEDDNIVPWNAHLRLLETMEAGPDRDGSSEWDAVSALYHVKDPEFHDPMAYGDAAEYRRTGKIHFHPVNLMAIPGVVMGPDKLPDISGIPPEHQVLEVLGVGMGCLLIKLDCFREIPGPWFETIPDRFVANRSATTQDIGFCSKMIAAGKRMATDLGLYVWHKDVATGRVF